MKTEEEAGTRMDTPKVTSDDSLTASENQAVRPFAQDGAFGLLRSYSRHRDFVRLALLLIVQDIERRSLTHDASKMLDDEFAGFARINAVAGRQGTERHGAASGAWADLVWLPCRDGKSRPTQSGLQPLAHGVSARVGRLRGYGNAIVPQVAAEVIRAYMGSVEEALAL